VKVALRGYLFGCSQFEKRRERNWEDKKLFLKGQKRGKKKKVKETGREGTAKKAVTQKVSRDINHPKGRCGD